MKSFVLQTDSVRVVEIVRMSSVTQHTVYTVSASKSMWRVPKRWQSVSHTRWRHPSWTFAASLGFHEARDEETCQTVIAHSRKALTTGRRRNTKQTHSAHRRWVGLLPAPPQPPWFRVTSIPRWVARRLVLDVATRWAHSKVLTQLRVVEPLDNQLGLIIFHFTS